MQHMRLIDSGGGGGGRFFAGGGGMRLRPHHHDLKCPRCDSLNTKFCYYNNYNLSQPRHFCKSCRRYWTKGGVLRNIPVGGAVRKTKRSSKPKSKTPTPPSAAVPVELKSSNSENSSSGSSRTTDNTTATTTPITTTEMSATTLTDSTPATLHNFSEPSKRFFTFTQSSTPITTFNPLMLNQSSARNMSPEIGSFTNMITPSTDDQLPSEFNTTAGIPSFQLNQQNPLQWTGGDGKTSEMRSSAFVERTAEIDYEGLGCRRSNGGLAGKDDWENTDSVDEGLMFDLTGTVDQGYWSQSQWNEDPHLNFSEMR